MMLAPFFIVAAVSVGLPAQPTPIERVKQVEGLLPILLRPNKALDPLLANADDLRALFAATGGATKDVEHLTKMALSQQRPVAGPPIVFAAVEAISEPRPNSSVTNLTFFDGNGQSITVQLYHRKTGASVIVAAAAVEKRDLAAWTKGLGQAAPRVDHFVKNASGWTAAAPLVVAKDECTDRLKRLAKNVYRAQRMVLAGNDSYTTKPHELELDATALDGGSVIIKDAKGGKSFVAEVSLLGGKAIVDESNNFSLVVACKDAP